MTIRKHRSRETVPRSGRAKKRSFERLELRVLFAADSSIGSHVISAEDDSPDEQPAEVSQVALQIDPQIEPLPENCGNASLETMPPIHQPPPAAACEIVAKTSADNDAGSNGGKLGQSTSLEPDVDVVAPREQAATSESLQLAANRPGGPSIHPAADGVAGCERVAKSQIDSAPPHSSLAAEPFHYFTGAAVNGQSEQRSLASRPSAADLQHDSFVAMNLMTPRSLPSPTKDPLPTSVSANASQHRDSQAVDKAIQQWKDPASWDAYLLDQPAITQEAAINSEQLRPSNDSGIQSTLLGDDELSAVEQPNISQANQVPTEVSLAALALLWTFVKPRDRHRAERPSLLASLRIKAIGWLENAVAGISQLRSSRFSRTSEVNSRRALDSWFPRALFVRFLQSPFPARALNWLGATALPRTVRPSDISET